MTAAEMPEPPSNVVALGKKREPARAEEGAIKLGADVHRVVDDCAGALPRCSDLFVRCGELARVVRDGAPPPNVRREPGAPVIRPVPAATLLEMLTRVQSFVKFDRREMKWVDSVPTAAVLAALAARGAWNGLRPIVGVLDAPALRPDGSIIQAPGYDAATGYSYEPTCEFPPVADKPTKADALAARDELLDVVVDFPFAGDEHRSAWLAFALTLFARPAIDGCIPLFAVDATAAGTGKGRLTDATAILGTGREATKTPLPQDDEEARKRITALLIEGERLAVIDNVKETIDLPSLDAALTATIWRDRVLGKNASVTVPNRIVWSANGNNLAIGGDLGRRTLHIRLESRVEDPENRTGWKHHPLLPWVRTERPRLVRAALTILRAHAVAGRPYEGQAWGSFESWSHVVAGAVRFVEMTDPQQTRAGVTLADAAKQATRALIEGWARLTAGVSHEGMTAKRAIEILYPAARQRARGQQAELGLAADTAEAADGFDDLREAIEALVPTHAGKPPTAARLGAQLRRIRRRVMGGRMLDGRPDRKGVTYWLVLGAAGDAGVAGPVTTPLTKTVSDNSEYTGGNDTGRPGMSGSLDPHHPSEHAFAGLGLDGVG